MLFTFLPLQSLYANDAIAFFYGDTQNTEPLNIYDRVVIQPNQTSPKIIQHLKSLGTTVYGYLSVSELLQNAITNDLKPAIIGNNKIWKTLIFDLSNPIWQRQVLQAAKQLQDMGFDGVFLDTLDSYRLTSLSSKEQRAQRDGLADIIQRLSLIFSGHVLINRGFDVLEQVSRYIQAVVTESVFYGYTPAQTPATQRARYYPTTPSEREWILTELAKAKALGLEVIVIDYLPHQPQRYAHANTLLERGFTPYVTDGLLQDYGISTTALIRNRLLALYDSTHAPLVESRVFTTLALPFERAGYAMDFRDIATEPLPRPDVSRYAGVIIWLAKQPLAQTPEFAGWISTWSQSSAILWIDTPTSRFIQKNLGFQLTPLTRNTSRNQWRFDDPHQYAGFENTLTSITPILNQSLKISEKHQPFFSLITPTETYPLAIQTTWGVAAVANSLLMTDPFQDVRWILNPTILIHDLLHLPPLPTADTTTESGRRIVTTHIDGDGFPSRTAFTGHPYTAEVIHDHILTKYPDFPTTVSIIESEIAPHGLHPKDAPTLEAIARRLFELPHVEIASHSFSHPFYWRQKPQQPTPPLSQYLPVKNYVLDFKRETQGSINYINNTLAPASKKTAVFLWSGSAEPTPETIALTAKAGVENVNGGNTHVTKEKFLLSKISPTIAPYRPQPQVLAPVMNETVYSHLWQENFGGYQHAIDTLELLDHNERLKSIGIYYHMYSGEYPASLQALKTVYDWVRTQETTPLWLSEYAKRARATHRMVLGSTLRHLMLPHSVAFESTTPNTTRASSTNTNHAYREPIATEWTVVAPELKTLRLPHRLINAPKKYVPLLSDDPSIAGYRTIHNDLYVHLTHPKTQLSLTTYNPAQPYLFDSNGQIDAWHTRTENRSTTIDFYAKSHVPLELRLTHAADCLITYYPDTAGTGPVHFPHFEPNVPQTRTLSPTVTAPPAGTTNILTRFHFTTGQHGLTGRVTCQH